MVLRSIDRGLSSSAAYSFDVGGPSGDGTANPDTAQALLYSVKIMSGDYSLIHSAVLFQTGVSYVWWSVGESEVKVTVTFAAV